MCISPSFIPGNGLVACRKCWQCRKNRVNDLVGRCIAEQHKSTATLAVTLTYAGDTVNAATLVYADFQRFVKRLRKAGYSVRYIVAGEYGSEKGRAHWHAILFFLGKFPQVELEKRVNWEFWPEGFAYFQSPDYGGFAYLLKYVLKDHSQEVRIGHLAMSKKPPLGYSYFLDLAEQYVAQGLSPQAPEYRFRDVKDAKGKIRRFWLQGRMRELFCEYFVEAFEREHARPYPFSAFVEDWEDKCIREGYVLTDEKWNAILDDKDRWRARPLPDTTPPGEAWHIFHKEGLTLVRYSDGTAEILSSFGDKWLVENERQLDRALEICAVDPIIRRRVLSSRLPGRYPAVTGSGRS